MFNWNFLLFKFRMKWTTTSNYGEGDQFDPREYNMTCDYVVVCIWLQMRVVQPYKNVALNRYTLVLWIDCVLLITLPCYTQSHNSKHTHTHKHTRIHSRTQIHTSQTHRTSDLPWVLPYINLIVYVHSDRKSHYVMLNSLAFASFNETYRILCNAKFHENLCIISVKMYFCTNRNG